MSNGGSLYAAYNAAMAEIAAADPLCFVIDTSATSALGDGTHWDYRGLLIIAERIVDQINGAAGNLAAPAISPAAGSYPVAQTITVTGPSGATLRLTSNGETPTSHSPVYSGSIAVPASQTIKAAAFRQGFKNSAVTAAVYAINQPLAAPAFSPAGGTYASAQTVSISGPAGATIRMTTDGSTPSSASAAYSGPVTVSTTQTIKAIAQQSGFPDSGLATATYTIAAVPAYLTWTAMTGAQQTGDYLIPTVTAQPSGARATQTIDASQPFSVITEMPSATEVETCVFHLDDEPGTEYRFDGINNIWVAGIFFYGGSLYSCTSSTSYTSTGAVTLPLLARLQKSGNDVTISKSADNGATWTLVATLAGVLAGKTTLYPKILWAAPNTQRRVRVRIA